MLALFGRSHSENDSEEALQIVGALLVTEMLTELRAIRRLLTAPKE